MYSVGMGPYPPHGMALNPNPWVASNRGNGIPQGSPAVTCGSHHVPEGNTYATGNDHCKTGPIVVYVVKLEAHTMAYAFQVLLEDGTPSATVPLKPRLRGNSAAADAWEICQELRKTFPVKGFRMLYKNKDRGFRPDGRKFTLR